MPAPAKNRFCISQMKFCFKAKVDIAHGYIVKNIFFSISIEKFSYFFPPSACQHWLWRLDVDEWVTYVCIFTNNVSKESSYTQAVLSCRNVGVLRRVSC
jgi:hypothetical protein